MPSDEGRGDGVVASWRHIRRQRAEVVDVSGGGGGSGGCVSAGGEGAELQLLLEPLSLPPLRSPVLKPNLKR